MGALTDTRKRVSYNSVVGSFGKGDYGFQRDLIFENEFCDDTTPSKKLKSVPLVRISQPVIVAQSAESVRPTIAANNCVSGIARLPPPAPLRREVHGPKRSLKYGVPMNYQNGSVKPWREALRDRVCDDENLESKLEEHKKLAMELIRVSRKDDNNLVMGQGLFSYDVSDVSEDQVPSGHVIPPQDLSIESLDREQYERMVEACQTNIDAHRPMKTQELQIIDVDGPSQPSSSVAPSLETSPNFGLAKSTEESPKSIAVIGKDHGKHVYLQLLESSKRRDPKLRNIDFDIEFIKEKLARSKIISEQEKKRIQSRGRVEDKFPEAFAPLTEEDEEDVAAAFLEGKRQDVLVMHENSNIEITRHLLRCLQPGVWLNDEVINVYLELLKERELTHPTKFLKCHFFNTFFYKKLIGGKGGYDYKAVRRWTTKRKLGYTLTECDKIFVPIHKDIHWCLAVIDLNNQKFQYLDSLGGFDSYALSVLARYLMDEAKDKNGEDIDISFWEQESVQDLPEQQNGSDCGVFMVKYIDFYSRGLNLCFTQDHMPYFRLRTAKEILRLRAD